MTNNHLCPHPPALVCALPPSTHLLCLSSSLYLPRHLAGPTKKRGAKLMAIITLWNGFQLVPATFSSPRTAIIKPYTASGTGLAGLTADAEEREREGEREAQRTEGRNISNGTAVPAFGRFSLLLEPYVASFSDFLSGTVRECFRSLVGCAACIRAVALGCSNNTVSWAYLGFWCWYDLPGPVWRISGAIRRDL